MEVISIRFIYLRHFKMYAGDKVNGIFTSEDAEELETLSSFFRDKHGRVLYSEAFEMASDQSIMDAQVATLQRVRMLKHD